ncbi:anhydro-N-acetylmuramic acid kinase [Pannus brasiliensis CCIBt3594]|uniref:Anhydro-N-acetylmuramic acid kinase n=1 Tax=Pannus brasiliensis CCIBt3594 TaxID=1427578 RepID=A0AAW9QTI2_9CHRO
MLAIGLISGTSVDGIDAAFVEIDGDVNHPRVQLLAGETYPYPEELRERILEICAGKALSVEELADLDDAIALSFARAAMAIQQGQPRAEIIGSHGQTVFHRPPDGEKLGYSVQLGRGESIARITGIETVSNFRAADIAIGGHGAPLVPKIDAYLLSHPTKTRCVQNLGGIGNVAYLPPRQGEDWESRVFGWDTGPGNVLIDLAVQLLTDGERTFDRNGEWAATGTPCRELVDRWLEDPYFHLSPPKSTGRELFSPAYLERSREDARGYDLSAADWLATLTDLTAASIAHSYRTFLPRLPDEVLLCGGGARNDYLRQRLLSYLGKNVKILTTDEVGLNGDFKEAIAFAVLAYWRINGFSGNLPSVTGAPGPVLLGEIHAFPAV